MNRYLGRNRTCSLRGEHSVRADLALNSDRMRSDTLACDSIRRTTNPFMDEAGFTMPAMVVALLLVCALIFTSAQVYQINSRASRIQYVADACVLAAESQVGEFMIVVRMVDACVLSLGLTAVVVSGLGLAALCTPVTAKLSPTLLKAGKEVLQTRNKFAQQAVRTLNTLQSLLPFIAACSAYSVARANSEDTADYYAYALLIQNKGETIEAGNLDKAAQVQDAIDEQSRDIQSASEKAEECAQKAQEYKQIAFDHDCGLNPSYCMYERAESLAKMLGTSNPLYQSVDTWSFSVALKRAQSYYPERLAREAPNGNSVEEQARSQLRKQFYEYAQEELSKGYVHETEDSFRALFPLLPSNTEEMRASRLYTDSIYPITETESGACMHAFSGCPRASNVSGYGSIAQMDREHYETCPECKFSAASMGKVAAASSSIDNGFEYHYRIVAEAARSYEEAYQELEPLKSEVKQNVSGLIDGVIEALSEVFNVRISATPPGSLGSIAFVVNTAQAATDTGFVSSFVTGEKTQGLGVALSCATLVEEPAREGSNIIGSFLSGLKDGAGFVGGALDIVLDCWSGMLTVYNSGIEGLSNTLEKVIDTIPFASASGLGTWASRSLESAVEKLGFAPAELDALKPVLVNSAHVASQDESPLGARLLSVKSFAVEHPLSSTDIFSSLLSQVQREGDEWINTNSTIRIAEIELWEGGVSVPVEIALPQAVKETGMSMLEHALNSLRSVYVSVTGIRVWE